MGIRSPLARVRILLSSSTVLRDSIHRVSTGPSKVIQVLNLLERWLLLDQMVEKMPGIQSSLISLLTPYIS